MDSASSSKMSETISPNGDKITKKVKLQSSDNNIVEVDFEIIKCSTLIKSLVENLKLEKNEEPIKLYNITFVILQKVIEWATYHHQIDTLPVKDSNSDLFIYPRDLSCDFPVWDYLFLRVDHKTLIALMMAANYLQIESLVSLTSKMMVNIMKGKSLDGLRRLFEIKNNWTPEEEKAIQEVYTQYQNFYNLFNKYQ